MTRQEISQKVYDAVLRACKNDPEGARQLSWFWRNSLAAHRHRRDEQLKEAA